MKKTLLLHLLLWLVFHCAAQKHDNIWIQGGKGGSTPPQAKFGLNIMNFSSGSLKLEAENKPNLGFEETVASICDKTGKLALYCNGLMIGNGAFDTIVDSKLTSPFWGTPVVVTQGTIILPFPEKDSLYLVMYEEHLFSQYPQIISGITVTLHYCVVDMAQNKGKGAVLQKGTVVEKPKFPSWGKIAAIKHHNGRDWWIYLMNAWGNEFFRYELTKNGLKYKDSQVFGTVEKDGVGTAEFSPDGTKYARYSSVGNTLGQYLNIYDFDRCTGKFSNQRSLKLERAGSGVAFSPNSRYLYVGIGDEIRQYDTWENDLQKAEKIVAKDDGFGTCASGKVPAGYDNGQLAPDGKIYFCTQACSDVLHVIEKPNLGDTLCEVKSHSIVTPTWYFASMPKFPNFRMGKVVNPCMSAVEETEELFNVSIYPNPVDDILTIQVGKGTFIVNITDMQGSTIHKEQSEDTMIINTSDWLSGIYQIFIKNKNTGTETTEKVVVMRY